MTDSTPHAPPVPEDRTTSRPKAAEPQSLVGAMGQGARLGVKWMTYIIGPFAALGLLIAVGNAVYRLAFVEGVMLFRDPGLRWETLKEIGGPIGGYLVSCMWGIVAGQLVCPVAYLVKRGRRRSNEPSSPAGHAAAGLSETT